MGMLYPIERRTPASSKEKGSCVSGSAPRVIRLAATLALIAGGLAASPIASHRAHAASPTIAVTPTTAAPHAAVQISGSGFDPSSNGHTVTVDFLLTSSGGATKLGTAQTDGSGQIAAQQFTLPFTLDAPGPNQITATEEGNAALVAAAALTGIALHPQLNNGQPLAVPQGTSSVHVQAAGFAPNDTLTVTLNGAPLSVGGQSTLTADASGVASISVTLPQGSASASQTLTVTGSAKGAGQNDQAGAVISAAGGSATPGPTATSTGGPQPTSGLLVSPNPAAVGTTIRATAGGFQPNEPVTFTLHFFNIATANYAVTNAPATADGQGIATAYITIPASADGSKPGSVDAHGITSGVTVSAPLSFAQLARLSVSPSSALPGAQVTISGTGFVPGEALFVTSRLFPTPAGHFAVIDATGSFSTTVKLLETLQPGAKLSIGVSGSGGDDAATTFTVAQPGFAAVLANPTVAGAGTTITLTGHGFYANEALAFAAGQVGLTPLGAPMTDNTGAFTATATLSPTLAPGTYTIKVSGASSSIAASAPITVQPTVYMAEGFTGQGPSVFFHETLAILNAGGKTARGSIIYMFDDGTTKSIPITVVAHALLQEDVNKDVGPNRIVSAMVQTDQPVAASRTITRTDRARHTLDADFSPGVTAPQSTWYFAEGYSGVTFQPYLVLQNPSTVAVTATVALFVSKYPAKIVAVNLPAYGRSTLNLRAVLPNRSFSTRVTATGPIVAERVEYWGVGAGSGKYGAGVKPGVATPGKSWYFGYGSVLDGDQAYLSLFNPHTIAAHAQVVFFNGTGAVAGSTKITVPPGQRSTVYANSIVGARHSPIAAIVTSDREITAEEAQYVDGSPNVGAHAGAAIEGRPATARTWTFATGNTATYNESEYVFNPSRKATAVTVTFYGADRQVLSATYAVKPLTVISISANALKKLHAGAHGSVWTAKAPVVVTQVLIGKKDHTMLADQGVAS